MAISVVTLDQNRQDDICHWTNQTSDIHILKKKMWMTYVIGPTKHQIYIYTYKHIHLPPCALKESPNVYILCSALKGLIKLASNFEQTNALEIEKL